jgi:hypothetical protein
MKYRILLLLSFVLGTTCVFAQCNEFYQLEEGRAWEMESYNAKGKLSGKNIQKVTAYSSTANSFTSTIHSTMFNEKGKELTQGDLLVSCNNGTILIDMRNFVNEEQMKAFQSYEMKMESDNLELPEKLSVGQSLKDGSMTLTASNSPIPMFMTVTVTDRKVIAKETLTTPAGTFDCFKISSNSTFKTKMGIGMTANFSTFEWIAPKVAVVKTESYKNNKLQGYTLLTKWN